MTTAATPGDADVVAEITTGYTFEEPSIELGVLVAQLYARVQHLEAKVEQGQSYNRDLWAYCRRLLDLYYRHRRDGSPDPDPLPDEP